jgi:Mn-dependent DtxR family transcriptional regulator
MTQEVTENYLECILILNNETGTTKSIDIAARMNVTKPTVSYMMKQFKNKGLIEIDSSGNITLTREGRAIAEPIYDRHITIAQMFIYLGIDEKTAYRDACRIEHGLSDKTFEYIKKHFKNELLPS